MQYPVLVGLQMLLTEKPALCIQAMRVMYACVRMLERAFVLDVLYFLGGLVVGFSSAGSISAVGSLLLVQSGICAV